MSSCKTTDFQVQGTFEVLVKGLLIAMALVLAGCASGPRTVQGDVTTDVAAAPGAHLLPGVRYRYESTAQPVGQPSPDALQALAEPALQRVGAVHDEARAQVGVQVNARVDAYWADPYWGPSNPRVALGLGIGHGWHGGGLGLGLGWPLWDTSVPYYNSEVSLVMRDLASGAIVYSTQARHSGPWHDTDTVLAALFVAALQGYPAPTQRSRRVEVPLQPAHPPAPGSTPPGSAPPASAPLPVR